MSIVRFLLPLTLALATSWASNPLFEKVDPQPIDEIPPGYRLPTNVKPINYYIELEPHLDETDEKLKFTFNGKSTITIEVETDTNNITFHSRDLKIDEKTIKLECEGNQKKKENKLNEENKTTSTIAIDKLETIEEKNFTIIYLKEPITTTETNCNLTLEYTGILNDQLRGFYRSSYQDDENTRWLATTQFEPVGARQAFPCWDEPELKATFDITIKHYQSYMAISNMPTIKNISSTRIQAEDKVTTVFGTSPVMSTYLVAFVVSDFEKVSNKDNSFNVWTKPQAIENANFALEFGQQVMDELDEFTGLKYKELGVPKMDQISIPDFSAGAMENWGLVTYRESSLLYTENVTTTRNKQNIATTISHEFSHQWFGNSVTPKWWKYIWLNEGFATFFQYYITEKTFSKQKKESWSLMDQFLIKNVQESAFVIDASPKTRKMNQDAATPSQIQSLFDDIAYKKAASVIRMMQHFLTEDVFQKGLQKYLKDNKQKSVDSDDLFKVLDEVAKKSNVSLPKPLKDIMDSWVNLGGYPVVNVTKINSTVTVEQKRFFLVEPTKNVEVNNKWWVPINYIIEEAPQEKDTKAILWLDPHKQNIKIKNLNESQWVLFNIDQTGYYRVNYDKQNWERLANYLDSNKYEMLNVSSRSQLIDDALNLARAGLLKYETALKITLYLNRETDYIPWYTASRALNYLDDILQGYKIQETFHKYVSHKLQSFVKKVKLTENKEPDTHLEKLAKQLALVTACRYEVDDCKTFAKQKFEAWLKNTELSPDLKSDIICAGLQDENQGTWNKTLERYKKSTDEDEKKIILNGLGCAKSIDIARMFLALSLEKKPVIGIFETMKSIYAGNPACYDILIDFIQNNFKKIQAINKGNQLIDFLNNLADKITNINQYGKLAFLVEQQQLLLNEKFEGLTNAMHNLDWINKNLDDVTKWLDKNYYEEKKPNSASSITLTSFLIIIPVLVRFY